jgi:hypothetical protein
MTRILATLASLSLLLLAAALVLGLSIGDLYERPYPSLETSRLKSIHFLTGVAAALGTSRWCREVVETFRFDPSYIRESNRLKRRTFPWALAGMLAVVGIIALGAASDPATGRQSTAEWVSWHLASALGGIALVGWTYFAAWNNVHAQHAIIQELVEKVAEARRGQGLDVEVQAV